MNDRRKKKEEEWRWKLRGGGSSCREMGGKSGRMRIKRWKEESNEAEYGEKEMEIGEKEEKNWKLQLKRKANL